MGGWVVNLNLDNVFKYTIFFLWGYPLQSWLQRNSNCSDFSLNITFYLKICGMYILNNIIAQKQKKPNIPEQSKFNYSYWLKMKWNLTKTKVNMKVTKCREDTESAARSSWRTSPPLTYCISEMTNTMNHFTTWINVILEP